MNKEDIERVIELIEDGLKEYAQSGAAVVFINRENELNTIRTCLQDKLNTPDYKALAEEMYKALNTCNIDRRYAHMDFDEYDVNKAVAKYEQAIKRNENGHNL